MPCLGGAVHSKEQKAHRNCCDHRACDQCSLQASLGRLFPKTLLQFLRHFPVADFIGVEINDGNLDAMFDFDFAQVVQVRFPTAVLRQIFRGAFREKNVPGIGEIHDALRRINSGAGDV